jgi:hypothetical protein
MAAAKQENYFFIVFLRQTSAVHLLLGEKIHLRTTPTFSGSGNSMALLGRLQHETEQKFKMAAAKTGCTSVSASVQDSKEIPTANPEFLRSENAVALLVMIYLEPEVRNSRWRLPNRRYMYLSFYTR